MRVARHQHVLILLALLDEFVEQHLHAVGNLHQFVACKEFQVHQYLVIARTAGMNLLAYVAELARQHQLHLRMNILYAVFDDEHATLRNGIYIFQFSQ